MQMGADTFDPGSLGPVLDLSGFFAAAVVGLLVYAYVSVCLMVVARKTGTPNGWLAWIPIGNLFLMANIGRKPVWWAILALVPLLNIIAIIVLFMGMATARGKSSALGLLILVPIVGLLVPLLLASGGSSAPAPPRPAPSSPAPSGPPPEAPQDVPRTCPQCGEAVEPDETFCGECGANLAAPTPAPAASTGPAPSSSGSPLLIGCLGLVIVLGVAGWFFIGRDSSGSGNRRLPAMPQRVAGVLSEFPVDTDPAHPARPTSVVRQNLRQGADDAAHAVPASWMPPGVEPADLVGQASAVTSATYRVVPGQPAVNVHVIETEPGPMQPGLQITDSVSAAVAGSSTSGIQVQSADGETYQGWRVQSPEVQVFVLESATAPLVIVINTSEPSLYPVAERLAANVSNGQGLSDYPEIQNSVGALPAELPAGMELEEISTFAPEDLGISAAEISGQIGGELGSAGDELSAQIQRFIPQQITTARYTDSSRQPWDVIIGDYGSPWKAAGIWLALRLLGAAGMESGDIGGRNGLWVDSGDGDVVLTRAGRSIMALKPPAGSPRDQVAGFVRGFQF